jgi:hypothetical protein
MNMPQVLGLGVEAARSRLEQAGFVALDMKLSGRRKEGEARVIRQRQTAAGVELIASRFKSEPGQRQENSDHSR